MNGMIGIAGAGGIGSNVARILAQAKASALKIIDFDVVEASNLNRQFYGISQVGKKKVTCLAQNLIEIYPEIKIEVIHEKITPETAADLFSDCAVVVEALDDKTAKKWLVESLCRQKKTIVCASGIAGQDMTNISCTRLGNCHIVGDRISDQEIFTLFPPKIAIISALMAGIVLKTIGETAA